MNKVSILIIIMMTICMSCGTDNLSPNEYIEYVERKDGDFKEKFTGEEYTLEIFHTPKEYLALKDSIVKGKSYFKSLESYGNMMYFNMTLKSNDGNDLLKRHAKDAQEVQRKVYYFSYDIKKDISLIFDGEIYPCEMFHFERSYDLKKDERNMIVGFYINEKPEGKASVRLSSTFMDFEAYADIIMNNSVKLKI
ncbi:hypothetical protein [Aureibacter tunicatorum]|uniref:Uncharacterized protein n=1 Tax=Aureibacter tunicatorum TaxID=866807 RepID=A0AAE3XQ73_9BACT|nr:hypothetical protein [Aureibacter tunicatorum]MDR6242016.1 hypothetical protein [Aureibacter tunicatorum]BDD07139.1 hypothetical protein AUTU_46220 [Aureibacter tunicatorum]